MQEQKYRTPCGAVNERGNEMILDGTLDASVQAAAVALQQGQLLGLPTETVYGLAADSDNDAAVAQIFAAKGRPANR